MTEYNGQEKREYPRVNANLVVNYRIQELPDTYDLSQTKNISQGGILITTSKLFEKGIQLTMNLRIPLVPQRVKLSGEVVESREVVRDLIYETRVKFLGLDEDFFKKLGNFIRENLK
ncbi:MAG: PilZ domain-containing protein [Candidatus Omnitrophica bacterium]|nr:PilZ domain-containing protein [Candidatus Omnitrophota bacterium]